MKRILAHVLSGVFAFGLLGGVEGDVQMKVQTPRIVDDFEQYRIETTPDEWVRVNSKKEVRRAKNALEPGERFEVLKEDGNQFARLYTNGEYIRFSKRNGKDFDWSLRTHPRLKWRWRAPELPEGASEKGENDTGGAVYVTFGQDWLGRPKSIKYTYSSSLPVGTVVTFGPLKVIVVDSAAESRQGKWQTVHRNVVNDYRQVFGGTPPNSPISITISGDSDSTGDISKVDIDDIKLSPAR